MKNHHYFDLYTVFKIPKMILSIFGYWPNTKNQISAKIVGTVGFILQLLFVSTMVLQMTYSYNTPNIFFEMLTIFTPPMSYVLKQLWLTFCRNNFVDLYEFLGDDTLVSIPHHLHPLIQKPLRIAKLMGLGYQINSAIAFLFYNAVPLITEKTLPVHFSVFELGRLYPAMYFLQFWGTGHTAANNTSIDFLAYNFMSVIIGQAKVLNEKFRTFEGLKGGESEEDLIKYLCGCVYHHNKIILLVHKVEKVFSIILLIQYLTSIMVICNIGFQLVIVRIFSLQFFVMVLFFLAVMWQLGIYCWFGNEIVLNSLAVREACYQSDWIDSSIRVRKILTIIMERGKRPLYLTAGKFSILSLASFTSVINSAYSFFALIRRTYRQSEND